MAEAIDAAECNEIVNEMFKEVEKSIRSQNNNTLEKTLTIALDVFSKGDLLSGQTSKVEWIQLPTQFGFLDRTLKDIKDSFAEFITEITYPFDKLEFVVQLTVGANEAFAETKTFDQLNMIVSKQAS